MRVFEIGHDLRPAPRRGRRPPAPRGAVARHRAHRPARPAQLERLARPRGRLRRQGHGRAGARARRARRAGRPCPGPPGDGPRYLEDGPRRRAPRRRAAPVGWFGELALGGARGVRSARAGLRGRAVADGPRRAARGRCRATARCRAFPRCSGTSPSSVPAGVTAGEVEAHVSGDAACRCSCAILLFDVYEGGQVGRGAAEPRLQPHLSGARPHAHRPGSQRLARQDRRGDPRALRGRDQGRMMAENLSERLEHLERSVKQAAEAIAALRKERDALSGPGGRDGAGSGGAVEPASGAEGRARPGRRHPEGAGQAGSVSGRTPRSRREGGMAEVNRVEVEMLGQKYTIRSAAAPGVRAGAGRLHREAHDGDSRQQHRPGPDAATRAGGAVHHRRAVPAARRAQLRRTVRRAPGWAPSASFWTLS